MGNATFPEFRKRGINVNQPEAPNGRFRLTRIWGNLAAI